MQARLAAVVQDAHDAVIAKDLDGVITAWNDAAERIYGYPAAEAIGRHISILIPDDHRNDEEVILGKIRSGARIETYETERIRADGVRIDVSLTISPINDPEAGIIGASIVARDVTAERRRRDVQAFVARAAAFHGSLDPRETARTIVESAVPGLCDLCVIDLVLADGTIGDATVAANDMEIAEGLRALRREAPIDAEGAHPVAEVIRTGRPMVVGDLTAPGIRSRVAQSDEHARFVARHGYSSAVVVPLRARGRSLGALSFLRMRNDRRYDDHDLALFEDVGARAAVAIDNARLYHERSRIAAILQRSLRPDRRPDIPDVDLEAIFEPAGEGIEVGGDFYDLLPVDQRWLLLIGDVAGKGPGAAALTGQIRHTVRALAVSGCSAAGLLERVNQILYEADGRDAPRHRAAARAATRRSRLDRGRTDQRRTSARRRLYL